MTPLTELYDAGNRDEGDGGGILGLRDWRNRGFATALNCFATMEGGPGKM